MARTPTRPVRPWRRALAHGVLAMGLSVAGVADACTLDALLRLPLERLLELKIGAQQCSLGIGPQPNSGLPIHGGTHAA